MTERELFAGIDLGGTKILVVISDGDGKIIGSARTPTLAAQGSDAVVGRIVETTRAAAGDAGVEIAGLRAAGVSSPGPINVAEGVLTDPPNLPGWHNVPLARILREHLSLPVFLENDANCAAVGEHRFGAGVGYRHLVYITVSTGIGAGLILDGRLYAGASGAAGEVGHLILAAEGPSCGAGHTGCLEALASGTAIAARARETIDAGGLPRTARLAEQDPPLSAKTVYLASQQGESEAAAIIEGAGRYLGMGLASLINVFNPQVIVIGGGLTNMGEALLGPAVETARARSFAQSFMDVRIVEAALGERGAALGAIAVAKERCGHGPA
ncbi:MAG: ROK family protein [Dehalococcoidia bacterium]